MQQHLKALISAPYIHSSFGWSVTQSKVKLLWQIKHSVRAATLPQAKHNQYTNKAFQSHFDRKRGSQKVIGFNFLMQTWAKMSETMTCKQSYNHRLAVMHHNPVTWSSSGSSPKAGIYLAHSTKTSNCCLIESQRSPTLADFCSDMSAIPTGAVIWREGENKGFNTHQLTHKHDNRKITSQ